MDPTTEFDHWWTTAPERLDLLTAAMARNVHRSLRTGDVAADLDSLADDCPHSGGLEICRWLSDTGFSGNSHDYYDPENSMIDSVLRTRRGIPITLSVVALEVSRRRDAPLIGITMPGEFLVADPTRPDEWVAPYRGGDVLDLGDVEALFRRLHGPGSQFSPHHLAPVDASGIVTRMLNNLLAIYRSRREVVGLRWVLALRRGRVPDSPTELVAHSDLAALEGRFDDAADLLDRAANLLTPTSPGAGTEASADGPAERSGPERLRDGARRMRARLN